MDIELRQKWLQKFNMLGADGVDFVASVPVDYENVQSNKIEASFTKKEFLELKDYNYPRLPSVFWKLIFGQKCYLTYDHNK